MSGSVRANAHADGSGTSIGVTITPAVGDLFVVWASCLSFGGGASWTCTDNNGGTYTQVDVASCADASFGTVHLVCFVRDQALPNTTSTTVTIADSGGFSGILAAVDAIAGSLNYGTAAIRSYGHQNSQTSGATPTVVMNNSALSRNMTIGMVGSSKSTTGAVFTPPSGYSEDCDFERNLGMETNAIEVASRATGSTSNTLTWGSSSTWNFGAIAVEVDVGLPEIEAIGLFTFDAMTVDATGAVENRGVVDFTFDDMTVQASSVAPCEAVCEFTFDDMTCSASGGAPPCEAICSFTFDDMTCSSYVAKIPPFPLHGRTLRGTQSIKLVETNEVSFTYRKG